MGKGARYMVERYTQSDNKIQAVCFTGHRDIDACSAYLVPSTLKAIICEAVGRGARRFLAGGAMGFDTIAALCVLEMKNQFPDIKLELILPCRNQANKWSEINKRVYDSILERADRVEYLHDVYTATCMHDRNKRLVDCADLVISYLTHNGGGTAHTVAYALKQGRELVNIDDFI